MVTVTPYTTKKTTLLHPWLILLAFFALPGVAAARLDRDARADADPVHHRRFTVKNGTKGLEGWGDPIAALCLTRRRSIVVNAARGGRSSRTYLTEGLWDQSLTQIKARDFVLMQFGHNDGGSVRPATAPR